MFLLSIINRAVQSEIKSDPKLIQSESKPGPDRISYPTNNFGALLSAIALKGSFINKIVYVGFRAILPKISSEQIRSKYLKFIKKMKILS